MQRLRIIVVILTTTLYHLNVCMTGTGSIFWGKSGRGNCLDWWYTFLKRSKEKCLRRLRSNLREGGCGGEGARRDTAGNPVLWGFFNEMGRRCGKIVWNDFVPCV